MEDKNNQKKRRKLDCDFILQMLSKLITKYINNVKSDTNVQFMFCIVH